MENQPQETQNQSFNVSLDRVYFLFLYTVMYLVLFADLTPFTALLFVLLATLNYITIILELVIELRIQMPWNDYLEEEKSDA